MTVILFLARNSCTKQSEPVHCHGGEPSPPNSTSQLFLLHVFLQMPLCFNIVMLVYSFPSRKNL
jgi:hypothetical protein